MLKFCQHYVHLMPHLRVSYPAEFFTKTFTPSPTHWLGVQVGTTWPGNNTIASHKHTLILSLLASRKEIQDDNPV